MKTLNTVRSKDRYTNLFIIIILGLGKALRLLFSYVKVICQMKLSFIQSK